MTALASVDAGHELGKGLAELQLPLSRSVQTGLLAYLALLAKWTRTYNLTAIRDPARMLTHHVLDALAVLPHLPPRAGLRVLDVGSGGGVPGLPFALARPDWRIALCESNQKKVAFLTQARIELALRNVTVHGCRVEDLAIAEGFDVVISRAFADLATFARLAIRQVAPGGVLIAMKGEHPAEEISVLPNDVSVLDTVRLDVPGLDAQRHLVVMRPKELTR